MYQRRLRVDERMTSRATREIRPDLACPRRLRSQRADRPFRPTGMLNA